MESKELKIGDKVYKININIPSSESRSLSSFDEEGVFIEELTVVYQTKYKIALSDDFITLIDKKNRGNSSCFEHIEDINVSIRTKEDYFSNGVFAKCLTIYNSNKQIEKIKKEIINQVNKRYGFLFNGIENKLGNLKIKRQ